MGGSRFSELQRGLRLMSPTILTKRLASLADHGLVVRKRLAGQSGYAYYSTESCKQLLPVIVALGEWSMRWARDNLLDQDFDVEWLMLYLQRSVRPDKLIGEETVIRFKFTDIKDMPDWWLIATAEEVDVFINDPGKEVDVYFTCTVRTMAAIWMGTLSYKKALREKRITAVGAPALTRNIFAWMSPSIFDDLPSAAQI